MKLYNRIKETTTTSGSGTISLGGAVQGFSRFNQFYTNGDTLFYCIVSDVDYEIGKGTYSSNTVSRDEVLSSTNSNNKVNFISNTKQIYVTYPGEKAVFSKEELQNNRFLVNSNSGIINSTGLEWRPSGLIIGNVMLKGSGNDIVLRNQEDTGSGILKGDIRATKLYADNNSSLVFEYFTTNTGFSTIDNFRFAGFNSSGVVFSYIDDDYSVPIGSTPIKMFHCDKYISADKIQCNLLAFTNPDSYIANSGDATIRKASSNAIELRITTRESSSTYRDLRLRDLFINKLTFTSNLPTTQPIVSGVLWSDSGVLKISQGSEI